MEVQGILVSFGAPEVPPQRDASRIPRGTGSSGRTHLISAHSLRRMGTADISGEPNWTGRWRLSVATVAATVLLLSWGGVVTSIGAGMAFPDWPTSLGSYNLINPVEGWWKVPAYLAEHGHRLIASLVGVLTACLAVWTWWDDPRSWMRHLGWVALGLVSLQGILGGLRVLWVSIDMAAIHACVAQLFFAVLVAMTLFTTDTWRSGRGALPSSKSANRLRFLAYGTTAIIYVQIVLGAVLRHSGTSLSPGFAAVHVTGALLVVGLVLAIFVLVEKHFEGYEAVRRASWSLLGIVGLQFALGLAALLVILYNDPGGGRDLVPVFLTVTHLVVGALLFGASIVVTLLIGRRSNVQPVGGSRRSAEHAAAPSDA